MKSIVAEFGSGFALLPRDVLDGELIESPFHIAKTHGSSFIPRNQTAIAREKERSTATGNAGELGVRPGSGGNAGLMKRVKPCPSSFATISNTIATKTARHKDRAGSVRAIYCHMCSSCLLDS